MLDVLEPLQAIRLTDTFIERFEALILSGRLHPGQRLPSERALAEQLGVSRPVVHEGLVALAARGLVEIRPRVGTVVSDYRREGSLALLTSLMGYTGPALDPSLLADLLAARRLCERETARLAARHHRASDLAELRGLLAEWERLGPKEIERAVDLDLRLHHAIALASDNRIYAMLLRSLEPAARALAGRFYADPAVWGPVAVDHRALVEAIAAGDEATADAAMTSLLARGEDALGAPR